MSKNIAVGPSIHLADPFERPSVDAGERDQVMESGALLHHSRSSAIRRIPLQAQQKLLVDVLQPRGQDEK